MLPSARMLRLMNHNWWQTGESRAKAREKRGGVSEETERRKCNGKGGKREEAARKGGGIKKVEAAMS